MRLSGDADGAGRCWPKGYILAKIFSNTADYGVEVRGLIHRAGDLAIITRDRERSLYIQWSSAGWRESEPVQVASEKPLLLTQALHQAEGNNYAARLSHTLGVPAPLITHWTQTRPPVPNDPSWAGAKVIPLDARR